MNFIVPIGSHKDNNSEQVDHPHCYLCSPRLTPVRVSCWCRCGFKVSLLLILVWTDLGGECHQVGKGILFVGAREDLVIRSTGKDGHIIRGVCLHGSGQCRRVEVFEVGQIVLGNVDTSVTGLIEVIHVSCSIGVAESGRRQSIGADGIRESQDIALATLLEQIHLSIIII